MGVRGKGGATAPCQDAGGRLPDRWLGIELRHLAALEAVAAEQSFARAARRLSYSQSSISQQVAYLERIVGERLVDRGSGPQPVRLTEPGRLLLGHARGIVAQLRAAQADLGMYADGSVGSIRLGTYQAAGAHVLPGILAGLAAARPRIDVAVTDALDDLTLLRAVEHGDLDAALATLPLPDGPFASIELLADPHVALVAAGSELARRGTPIGAADLAGRELVRLRPVREPDPLEAALCAHGVAPEFSVVASDAATVHSLVAAGMGVGLVPRLTAAGDARTAALPLALGVPPRTLVLAWHRDRRHVPPLDALVAAAAALRDSLADQ